MDNLARSVTEANNEKNIEIAQLQLLRGKQALQSARYARIEALLTFWGECIAHPEDSAGQSREGGITGAEIKADFMAAIKALPPHLKQFFNICFVHGWNPKTVSEAMKITPRRYTIYLHRLLKEVEQGMRSKAKAPKAKVDNRNEFTYRDGQIFVHSSRPEITNWCYAKRVDGEWVFAKIISKPENSCVTCESAKTAA